jgi:hypothetical protein|nr:DUF4271 domain-containing protein [uncultured Flavobacterium sp.]
MDPILHPRIIENKDWATGLFILSLLLIALTKSVFENRFNDFTKLIYSDKYIKLYRDSSHLMSGFTLALFVVQIISITFFLQLFLSYYGRASKSDWMLFIQLFTFITYFILAKFLLEKIIATAFKIEEFMEQFNLKKVTYRTYIGLIILPIDLILYYFDVFSKNIFLPIFVIALIINLFTYLLTIKNYQSLIMSKLFYFILYLCALEIAPYYFMYYWFTKGNT